ncbi:MAG: peptidyl-prolyl cis-trans isomerase [Planctomycetes bacterium]|nr:peptidyl-prolyl cis-trans isomerase [Planctomycetota bacterium]MCH7603084.1 peptidyl-prolyl cis-trans isomerase [Planctomycetota bacterium]
MKRLLKEPLLHFLLLGAGLFAASSFLSTRDELPRDAIVVSAGKIEHLSALYERTWQRPPTAQELEGLINDFIREEAAYREGMAFGLDRDDTIIRRRIRQKLDFIAEDIAGLVEPSDDELAAYLETHPDDFRVDPRLTFRQVYLNPDQHGESIEADARDLLSTLGGDAAIDASSLGDRIMLEHDYRDVSMREVASLFGEQFAIAIVELDPGSWEGPIESGYGLHLVMIDERTDARLPELDEVRDQVRREWEHVRRLEMTEAFYREMLDRYEIVVEWPEPDTKERDS